MVEGIDSFRDKFRDYTDCYTVIGGAACDILMSEAEIAFRATKDIDMILILEDKKAEFAKAFWEYIRDGGYRCGWKNNADVHFYRFTEPLSGFPAMIELFSRTSRYVAGAREEDGQRIIQRPRVSCLITRSLQKRRLRGRPRGHSGICVMPMRYSRLSPEIPENLRGRRSV